MLDKRFVRDPSMVFRRIAEECILVPIRSNVGDVESLYTLNEVGAQTWEWVDGRRSIREICDLIVGEFEVSREQAQEDALILFQQLAEIGAVRKVTADGV